MKILFISRAYPPILGGIENQNAALAEWLPKHADVTTIFNPYGRIFLPFFAPYALARALLSLRSYDIVLLGDGTISLIGWVIKKCTDKKVASVVHGLDINWNSSSLGVWYERALILLYRLFWVRVFIPSLDILIAVGNETIRQGIAHGIPESKFVFVPNGVDTDRFSPKTIPKERLAEILKTDIAGKRVIYTGGRLVRRKGVAWFIRNVLPALPENVLYAVSGDGPDRGHIEQSVADANMNDRVFLLGRVSDEDRDILLATCDLFVQPNIPVKGDMEGFGLVVLEAASAGIPVVVSRLEGLKDAIRDKENGCFAEPENAASFISAIDRLLSDEPERKRFGAQARIFTREHYHWEKISAQYIDILKRQLESGKRK